MRTRPERRAICRSRSKELASADGKLQFELQPLKAGVGIECTQKADEATRVCGWHIVEDIHHLQQGSEADELRHQDPACIRH